MKKFIVIARPITENNVRFMMTSVEVESKNWSEAYNKVREINMTPMVDTYIPKPSLI